MLEPELRGNILPINCEGISLFLSTLVALNKHGFVSGISYNQYTLPICNELMKFTELKSIKIPRRLLIQEVSNIAMLVRHHEHINIVTGIRVFLEVSKTEAIQDAYLVDLGLILERIRKTSLV